MASNRVEQVSAVDEIDCAQAEQRWIAEIVKTVRPEELPGEVTCDRVKDTNITTIWSKGRLVAISIRQRTAFNTTVMTMVEIGRGEQRGHITTTSENRK